jgi:hypothetical protein
MVAKNGREGSQPDFLSDFSDFFAFLAAGSFEAFLAEPLESRA